MTKVELRELTNKVIAIKETYDACGIVAAHDYELLMYFQDKSPAAIIDLLDKEHILHVGLGAVSILISESTGVYGLHLNGDNSPWDELFPGGRFEKWLSEFNAAIATS